MKFTTENSGEIMLTSEIEVSFMDTKKNIISIQRYSYFEIQKLWGEIEQTAKTFGATYLSIEVVQHEKD